MKTNAARLLEQARVPFEVREYEVDPDDLSAETVARKVGLPPAQVWKTLVVRGDRAGVCLAVVPADASLDLKAIAKARGDRKAALVPLSEVEPLTGYVRGGVTAFGCKKRYPVLIDRRALGLPVISVSAGKRGAQLLLSPADYVRATRAEVADLVVAD